MQRSFPWHRNASSTWWKPYLTLANGTGCEVPVSYSNHVRSMLDTVGSLSDPGWFMFRISDTLLLASLGRSVLLAKFACRCCVLKKMFGHVVSWPWKHLPCVQGLRKHGGFSNVHMKSKIFTCFCLVHRNFYDWIVFRVLPTKLHCKGCSSRASNFAV